jgi:hypothetical protein
MSDEQTTTGEQSAEVELEFTLVNEFAGVRVRKLRTRNGERLEIHSIRLGHTITLDALALEGLSWQDPETISKYFETPFGPDEEH